MSASSTVLQVNYCMSNELTYAYIFIGFSMLTTANTNTKSLYGAVIFYMMISLAVIGANLYLNKTSGKHQKRYITSVRAT